MSNISRRKFLKGAGVAALAVAAAGVLAGCSKDDVPTVPGTPDVPDVPQVTSKTVTIYFKDVKADQGIAGASTYEMTVLKNAKTIDPTAIPNEKLPGGYTLADQKPVEIQENGNQVFAIVPVKSTNSSDVKTITVKTLEGVNTFGTATAVVPVDATVVYLYQITLPEGYRFTSDMDSATAYPIDGSVFLIEKDAE